MAAEDPSDLPQKLQSLSPKWGRRIRSASSPAAPQPTSPTRSLDAVWPEDIKPKSFLPTNRSPVLARKTRSVSSPPMPVQPLGTLDAPERPSLAASSKSMNLAPIQESADKEAPEMQYSNDSSPNYSPVPGASRDSERDPWMHGKHGFVASD